MASAVAERGFQAVIASAVPSRPWRSVAPQNAAWRWEAGGVLVEL